MFCQPFSTAVFSSCWFLGAFCLRFCFEQVKCMLVWIQVRWLTGPWQNIPLLCLKKSLRLVSKYSSGHCPSVSVKCCQKAFEVFGWFWPDNIALYTSELILLLWSAVTSSLNTKEPVPLAALHAHCCKMRLYASDHEQFFPFSMLLSSHHYGAGWSLPRLSRGCSFRTAQVFFF